MGLSYPPRRSGMPRGTSGTAAENSDVPPAGVRGVAVAVIHRPASSGPTLARPVPLPALLVVTDVIPRYRAPSPYPLGPGVVDGRDRERRQQDTGFEGLGGRRAAPAF